MANFGALSSLGLGSSGALNYDILDKLRKVDEETQAKPLEKQLDGLKKREAELGKIITMTASLKSALFELSDPVLFAKRDVKVTGDGIDVSVEDGTAAQQIDVVVKNLAKADIKQSKGFANENAVVTTKDTDMSVTIDGQTTTFTVAAGTTLADLKDLVNEKMHGSVEASILNTGGSEPYRLVLKSAATGADQAMSFSFDDGDPNTADDDFLDLTKSQANVQDARDALFTFNGIDITRPSNTVDDLVVGLTLTLKKEGTDTNRISIVQDNEAIADKVQDFVDKYNELIGTLASDTKYDPDTKQAGIFQGEGSVTSLKLAISRLTLGTAPNGKGLADFGIDVTRDGTMTLDRSRLMEALDKQSTTVQETFAGTDAEPGVFLRLKNYLSDAAVGKDSLLSQLDDQLRSREKRLQARHDRILDAIETRYAILAKKFAAYDAIIGKMNASFQSLQSMIDAQANAAKK